MFDCTLGHYLTYHHVAQDFFRRHKDKFDGLIIPLSVAAVFKQGTGGFVLTLKRQYAIDPRTPLFQADFNRANLRTAHGEMAKAHGAMVERIYAQRPLEVRDFGADSTREIAQSVLEFQKTFAEQSNKKVEKYAALLGEEVEEQYGGPTFLIPPYFLTRSRQDAWYEVSLNVARAAVEEKDDYPVSPVIHIAEEFPAREFERVVTDYSEQGFDGLIVYINDLREYVASEETLTKYANFVQALAESGKPLFGLVGGYFTLLLRKIGLGCFSNGVGYGEYRQSGYYAGGVATRRYYIPAIHRYFSDIQAQSIIDIVDNDWFRCDCGVCRGRRRITDLTSRQLLDHFLNTRSRELKRATEDGLDEILDELERTADKLRRYRTFPTVNYEHLNRWIAALRPFV